VLGVDLGSRRIGLALSDPTRTVASPLDVLQRQRTHADDHRAILAAARENEARTIVVGLPLSLSGGEGPAAKDARVEAAELQAAAGDEFQVEVFDERLTTVTAERSLREARMTREARKRVVDKVAAAVMLQTYIEAHTERPR
jgi:putative Holliday junction resolvase